MAAADYAENPEKNAPPEELRLAFRCQQWGTLPYTGGLLDQPAGLMERMTIALNAYNSWSAYLERDINNEVNNARQNYWKVAMNIIELRKHE